MHYKMIKKNIPPEQGNYSPYSSARVNERALPLSPRSCREPGSNSQPLGHEPNTVTQSHSDPLYYGKRNDEVCVARYS